MRFARRALALSVGLLAVFSGTALAVPPYADISSAGPLTHVYIGDDLTCQADRSGALQVYSPSAIPGDCLTAAAYEGTLYSPPYFDGTLVPVSQTAVTGSGSSLDPYTVVTVVEAGPKLRLTETDTYVTGEEHWTTRLDAENLDSAPLATSIYHGMDCYLGGSDEGYGYQDGPSGGAGCSANADNSPAGPVEAFIPATGQGALSYEADYGDVWDAIGNQSTLDGTCICSTLIDNGVALQWQLNIAGGETKTIVFLTLFSPTGTVPSPPAAPPFNVTPPDAGTTAVAGTPLTGAAGTWNGATSQSQRWQRCTSTNPASCTDIPGATGVSYTPVAGDAGDYLRIVETATNGAGSVEEVSAMTQQVSLPAPPTVITPPAPPSSSGGDPVAGSELSPDDGSYDGAVGARSYQFQRCATDDPSSCVDIPDATGRSYTPTAADLGYRLRLVVTVSNAGGSTTSRSALSGVVHAASSTTAPTPAPSHTPVQCVSTRVMRLHWSVPAGARLRGFTVLVDGRKRASLPAKDRAVTIDLRGRLAGTVRVVIRGKTVSGHSMSTSRTYQTCAAVRPGKLKTLRLTG
ncbi:MAG: hypothetical protein V7607_6798 [Solirubrobacteraceae bacterium]